ncbi:conserved unknown protein [Ectocarpus siliculosus]|uniref:Uncharacterized protein n=1 Tax=Ectocarpus siliculosus TaxID=2880 RepID=D7FLL4_ECTSI|nr:conserved unknown protein [Ectocarpus siliculosus]|eukprot:CBJ25830.1 conserved unknown protein [Ectocarpus siliculosus]
MEGEWYLGKVLHTVDEEEEGGEGKPELQAMEVDGEGGEGGAVSAAGGDKETTLFRIHYQGWPNKYDETLSRDSPNLQPVHTHSKRLKKKPDRKKKRAKEVKEWIREDEFGNIVARGIVGEDDPYDPKVFDRKKAEVEGEAEETKPVPVEGATTNRYGRVVVPRVNLTTPKGKGKAKDPNGDDAECNEEEGEGGTADGETAAGKKRTNRKASAVEGGGAVNSADDWICAMCSQLDTPCMSDMVTCDGPCLRSFHVVCLDLGEDALKEEKWLCEDCERAEHECWQCGDYGQDNVVGGVFRCGVPSCGRFYHRHCVELNKNSVVKADVDEGEDGQPIFKFRCAYHTCDTCCSGRGGTKNHLYKCIKCPTAYHLNCIPPDARYHELALICEAHPEAELPALKQEDSILGRKGEGEGEGGEGAGEAAPVKFSLPTLKFPKHPPKAENKGDLRHFRLPMSILTSYHSKPPPFQHLCAMQFVAPKPPRVDPTPACNCSEGVCGDSCLNAMLRTECVCGNGIRAKYQNCKLGAGCGNRRLQNRVNAKVAPFREAGMGWGLKVAVDVPKGSLIGEYVGEVIDEAMVEHRMAEQRRLRPNDGEFYIMELGQSLFIDAKEKGNLMRLINHSCNPNCDVQAWNIAGYTRLGIYAKKDLAKGESLSYDYKFSTNEKARFKCMCGAENCRGTLAPKEQEEEITEDGSKLKGKARKEMLQKRERMAKNRQARSQVGQLVTCKRLSLTGRVLPGDRTAEVKAGPPAKYFGFARAVAREAFFGGGGGGGGVAVCNGNCEHLAVVARRCGGGNAPLLGSGEFVKSQGG